MDLSCNTTAAVTAVYLKLLKKKEKIELKRHFVIETLCVTKRVEPDLELFFTAKPKWFSDKAFL